MARLAAGGHRPPQQEENARREGCLFARQNEFERGGPKGDLDVGFGGDALGAVVDAQVAVGVYPQTNVAGAAGGERVFAGLVVEARFESAEEARALALGRGHDIEATVGGAGVGRELEAGAGAADVEDLEQEELVRDRAAVDLDLSGDGIQLVGERGEDAEVAVQFMFRFAQRVGSDVVDVIDHGDRAANEADPDTFDEVAFAPRAGDHTDVEGAEDGVAPAGDDVLGLGVKAEAAHDVVRGAERERGQRKMAVEEGERDFANGAVAAGHDHEFAAVEELGLIERTAKRIVVGPVAGIAHQARELLARPAFLAGFFVVQQDDVDGHG